MGVSARGLSPLQDLHSVVLHRVGVPIAAKTAQRVHMEVTDDGGWQAGAEVRIVGLVKTPQHNGKVGLISAKAPGTEGRVGVELGKDPLLCGVRTSSS